MTQSHAARKGEGKGKEKEEEEEKGRRNIAI